MSVSSVSELFFFIFQTALNIAVCPVNKSNSIFIGFINSRSSIIFIGREKIARKRYLSFLHCICVFITQTKEWTIDICEFYAPLELWFGLNGALLIKSKIHLQHFYIIVSFGWRQTLLKNHYDFRSPDWNWKGTKKASRLKSTIFFYFSVYKMLPFWLDVSISHLCHENENNIKLYSICIAFSPYFRCCCCFYVHIRTVIFHGWHIKFKWQQKQNRAISLHSPTNNAYHKYHRCKRSKLMIFYPFTRNSLSFSSIQ